MSSDENKAPPASANSAESVSRPEAEFAASLSPMIPAHERKRRILERRRRERERESSTSPRTQLSDSKSSVVARKRPRSDDGNGSQSQSDSSLLCSRPITIEANEQEDASQESLVEGTRSRFSLARRRTTAPLPHPLEDSACDGTTPKAKGRSTLFGAVMGRSSLTPVLAHTSTPTKPAAASRLLGDAGSYTPGGDSIRHGQLRWDASATPTSHSNRSRSAAAFQSPGGFGLQTFLDSVTSPLHLKHIHPTASEEEDAGSDSATPEAQPQGADQWQHALMDTESGSLNVLDWTIKRKIRIECQPSNCLPGSIKGNNGIVEQQAMHCFLANSGDDDDNASPESRWETACMYWQHPAVETTAVYTKETTKGPTVQPAKEGSISVDRAVNTALAMTQDVRGRHAFLTRFVRHFQSAELWRERREREWQEAFRSLYFKWQARVGDLQKRWGRGEEKSAKSLLGSCFYAVSREQTVLFCISSRRSLDVSSNAGVTSMQSSVAPTVMLSSASLLLRQKLRHMGVIMYMKADSGADDIFDEVVFDDVVRSEEETEPDMTRVDLEALRRAQAHGETAGADVSVSLRTKRIASKRSVSTISPIYLVGEDDCASFFELYLNTLGLVVGSWRTGNGDVPILTCRGLGPFRHASLQNLLVKTRRHGVETPQHDGVHSYLELRGQILPCALQELICSTACHLLKDSEHDQVSDTRLRDGEIGSHYFVMQNVLDEGKSSEPIASVHTTTGTAGTRYMNFGHPKIDNSTYLQPAGGMMMAVWDVARPSSLAFKIDSSTLVAGPS